MKRSLSLRLIALSTALGALAVLGLGATALAAHAQPGIPAVAVTATGTPHACDLACVIAFGDQRIADRQAALTKLSGAVHAHASDGTLTADQANTLQADITTNANGLAALKTKLDGETVATAARADVKDIYEQFRIFAVVLPRDYRQIEADIALNVTAKLKGLEPVIQSAISSAPSGIQAQLTTLYNDYTSQVTNAESQNDAAQAALPTLTPASFNANEAAYKTAEKNLTTDIQISRKDLHQAAKDLHQIAQLLKGSGVSAPKA